MFVYLHKYILFFAIHKDLSFLALNHVMRPITKLELKKDNCIMLQNDIILDFSPTL